MHALPDPVITLPEYYKDIRPSRARFRVRFLKSGFGLGFTDYRLPITDHQVLQLPLYRK